MLNYGFRRMEDSVFKKKSIEYIYELKNEKQSEIEA